MTVRVNKDSFNLREKLSELERPIGLKGSELMKAETAQEARNLVSAGRKNLVLNGNFTVTQRGTSFTINSSSKYTLDRWSVSRGGIGSLTVTQSSSGLGIHPKALKVESTSNVSNVAGTDTWIRYAMEDIGFQGAINYPDTNKFLSLSFWAKANTSGQYSVCITSGDFGRRFIHSFTLSANAWEYKTVIIPPAISWGYSNGFGLRIYFDLGSGSTYQNTTLNTWIYGGSTYAASGNTRVTGVSGRTFEVTGVQLECGRNATDFEYRYYGEELALCQRYYQKFYYGVTDYPFGYGYIYDAVKTAAVVPLPTSMKPPSSITFSTLRIRGGGSGSNDYLPVSAIGFGSAGNGVIGGLCQLDITHSNISTTSQTLGATVVLTNGISNSASYLAIESEL